MKILTNVLTVLLAVLGLVATASAFDIDRIPFETVDKGFNSAIDYERYQIIENDAQWLYLWEAHTEDMGDIRLPDVDFDNEVIIAVFMGWRHTNGYEIDIYDVVNAPLREGLDLFTYHTAIMINKIEEGGMLQVVTTPYHIIRVDRQYLSDIVFCDDRFSVEVLSEGYLTDYMWIPDIDLVIDDQETFNNVWAACHRDHPHMIPVIDFEMHSVVACFAGMVADPSWYVDVHSIFTVKEATCEYTLINTITDHSDGIFPQLMGCPFQLVLTEKIGEDVVFNDLF